MTQLERKLEKLRESLAEAEFEDNAFEAKKRKTITNHQRRMTVLTRNIGYKVYLCTHHNLFLNCIQITVIVTYTKVKFS